MEKSCQMSVAVIILSSIVGVIFLVALLIAFRGYQGKMHLDNTVLRVQLAQKERERTRIERRLTQQTPGDQYLVSTTLSDASYDVLLVVDETQRILAYNRNLAKLFNHDDPVGKSLLEATGMKELEALVQDVLLNEAEILEEQMPIKDEHYRVRTRVLRSNERILIGLALRDITQLVRLNRARRDMVANISHELRTPIANIRLIIDGLFHDQDRPRRKDSISSLREIAQETDNLLWLVQEMSDLSMIESGQAIVKLIDEPLHELVAGAMERLGDQSESRFVTINSKVSDELQVLCDRDLLRRVFVNLIHNALKWSPEGKTVTITADATGDEVTISVKDKGPGVPDDQVERIFERFYQTDESRSGNEGTGLGLAICRHIIEAHGGRIWAEGNSASKGGLFRFTLLNALPHP
jgi:two-component system, OmpR family, phosphate regulon sensor histidine kinase PhoR